MKLMVLIGLLSFTLCSCISLQSKSILNLSLDDLKNSPGGSNKKTKRHKKNQTRPVTEHELIIQEHQWLDRIKKEIKKEEKALARAQKSLERAKQKKSVVDKKIADFFTNNITGKTSWSREESLSILDQLNDEKRPVDNLFQEAQMVFDAVQKRYLSAVSEYNGLLRSIKNRHAQEDNPSLDLTDPKNHSRAQYVKET